MNPIFIARKSVLPLSLNVESRCPAIHTSPEVNSSMPDRQLRSVVLPHPDGPITATISPLRTSRSRPRSAWTAPPPLSYVFTRRRATTIRSSTRGTFAGADAGLGTVIDSDDIGGVLLGRPSEEPALHERFGAFLRRPQRRNAAASRVTVHNPRAARARRKPNKMVASAATAITPIARAASKTPSAARPPRIPPRETRKKMPSAANDNADGFSLIRVRSAAAANPPAMGDAIATARLSIGRPRFWVATRRMKNGALATSPIVAKLSMRPRKYAAGPCADVNTIHRFSRS